MHLPALSKQFSNENWTKKKWIVFNIRFIEWKEINICWSHYFQDWKITPRKCPFSFIKNILPKIEYTNWKYYIKLNEGHNKKKIFYTTLVPPHRPTCSIYSTEFSLIFWFSDVYKKKKRKIFHTNISCN